MKTIKIIFALSLLFLSVSGFAQEQGALDKINLENNDLKSKDKTEVKFFDTSYDVQNMRVRRVNDTLNIFIESQKKISIASLNIVKLENFEGFEKDIDGFFEMVNNLNLNFENKSYQIRYSPLSKEIIVSERSQFRYKSIEGSVLPVFRHEIIFTYINLMTDISFFLGEIDELLVLKEVSFSNLIKKEAINNRWFSDYNKNQFNKDLKIDANGDVEIITYKNIERGRQIDLGFNLGVSFLGNLFPIDQEISINYRVKGYNKWTQENNGFFISVNTYSFLDRIEDKRFDVNTSVFANIGFVTGPKNNSVRIYYGRLIPYNDENDYLRFNRNKFGVDVLVSRLIRVKSEAFFGSGDNATFISLGLGLNLISN